VWSLIVAIIPFAISMSLSPGPNNIMVTASAVNFGFNRTLPHMLGIALGFQVMLIAIGLGLGSIFHVYPQIHTLLKYVGAAYLLFLAYQIANAGKPKEAGGQSKPLTFLQAALFQWVNPKAWIIAVTAISAFTDPEAGAYWQIVTISVVFALIAFLSVAIWAAFGNGDRPRASVAALLADIQHQHGGPARALACADVRVGNLHSEFLVLDHLGDRWPPLHPLVMRRNVRGQRHLHAPAGKVFDIEERCVRD
jgi:threonine/homoserine/homoserine lactone efflux protein